MSTRHPEPEEKGPGDHHGPNRVTGFPIVSFTTQQTMSAQDYLKQMSTIIWMRCQFNKANLLVKCLACKRSYRHYIDNATSVVCNCNDFRISLNSTR